MHPDDLHELGIQHHVPAPLALANHAANPGAGAPPPIQNGLQQVVRPPPPTLPVVAGAMQAPPAVQQQDLPNGAAGFVAAAQGIGDGGPAPQTPPPRQDKGQGKGKGKGKPWSPQTPDSWMSASPHMVTETPSAPRVTERPTMDTETSLVLPAMQVPAFVGQPLESQAAANRCKRQAEVTWEDGPQRSKARGSDKADSDTSTVAPAADDWGDDWWSANGKTPGDECDADSWGARNDTWTQRSWEERGDECAEEQWTSTTIGLVVHDFYAGARGSRLGNTSVFRHATSVFLFSAGRGGARFQGRRSQA